MAEDRVLDLADLEGAARRIADYARSNLEAKNKVWAYLPSFREEVTAEAVAMLKNIVLHERLQSGCGAPDWVGKVSSDG